MARLPYVERDTAPEAELERRAIRYAEEMTVKVQVDAALVEALGTDLEMRTATPAPRP